MPHGHFEQFSLKSIKEIYIPAKIIIPCQFITDLFKILENYFKSKFIHTLNKTTGQPDFPFENESTMRTVMIDNYGCMKAVSGKSGRAILQNSY